MEMEERMFKVYATNVGACGIVTLIFFICLLYHTPFKEKREDLSYHTITSIVYPDNW